MVTSVLYVDDEPDLLDLCKIFLERDGRIHLDTLPSAPAALDLLKSRMYDAIISDYQMPEMDGIAFLKAVRQEHGSIPFILFTGRGREEVVIQALNEGADFYLQKGGDPKSQFAELVHKIRMAVDRKHAEEALRVNADRLSMAQEIGQAGSWEFDFATRTIWATEQAYRLFGFTRPAGTIPYDMIEATFADREMLRGVFTDIIQSGKPYDIEYAINPADGSPRKIIHSVARCIYDDQGHLVRLFGVMQDITEKKRREKELGEKEAMLNAAQRVARLGIWDLDLATNRIFWSDELFRILGREPGSFVPDVDTLFCFIHPDDREMVVSEVRDAVSEQKPFEIVFRVVLPDGTCRFIRDQGEPQFDAANRPVRIVGTALDITDQKLIELRLLESEEKHRLLLDEASDPIFSISRDGTYQYVNRAFADGVGRSRDAITGRKIFDVFPKDEAVKRFSVLNDVFATGIQKVFEVLVPRSTGDRYYLTTVTPIKDNAGAVLTVICSSKDITDRRNAEEELRKSEEKFRSLVERANDIVFSLVRPGVFTYVSPNWTNLLGHAVEDVVGKNLDSFVCPGDLPACREIFSRISTSGGNQYSIEYRIRHKNGTWRWHTSNISLVRDPGGNVISLMGIARDITERKEAEESLRASEERYRNLVDTVRDVIWQTTPGLQFTYISRYAENVIGYTPDEIVGKTLFDFLTPSSAEFVRQKLSLRLSGGAALSSDRQIYNVEMLTKDGRRIWIEVSTGPLFDPQTGAITGFQGISRDISERRHAEAALADRLVFQQTLIESIPYPVFIKDAAGRFVGCNRAYERVFGTTRDYLLGKTVLDLAYLAPEERTRFQDEDMAVIKQAGRMSYELPILYADGQIHQTLYSVDGFRLASGSPGGLIGMLVDITGRKQMEDALKQANRQLGLLTSITRHDINNKITAILGYLDLAEMEGAGHAPGEYVEKLKSLTQAIRSQIEFTKIYQDLGNQDPQWQEIDALLPRSNLPGQIEFSASVQGIEVFCDPMLPKVFFNLLDNSLRHGERVTRISVTASPTHDGLTLVWEDNGTGIEPGLKERIFDRGFGKNTGLGLFLVREILAPTRITIRETGIFGTGARFEILVPKGIYRTNNNKS
nr:PAS domain S-box protein [uncultured Methanoregula sp.]